MAVKLIAQILLLLKLTFWKIKTCKFLLTQSFTVIRRLITSFDLWRELLALHVLLFVLLCIKKIYTFKGRRCALTQVLWISLVQTLVIMRTLEIAHLCHCCVWPIKLWAHERKELHVVSTRSGAYTSLTKVLAGKKWLIVCYEVFI